jgi:hypothetical protein
VLLGQPWAKALGIVLAVFSGIANFIFLPYYPVWAIVLIAIDIFVVWALASSMGRATSVSEPARGGRPASRPSPRLVSTASTPCLASTSPAPAAAGAGLVYAHGSGYRSVRPLAAPYGSGSSAQSLAAIMGGRLLSPWRQPASTHRDRVRSSQRAGRPGPAAG